MITVNNINLSFKDREAFKESEITIHNNEITLIYGESGCGKTSILYVLGLLSEKQNG